LEMTDIGTFVGEKPLAPTGFIYNVCSEGFACSIEW
jgi:hypothetical protein